MLKSAIAERRSLHVRSDLSLPARARRLEPAVLSGPQQPHHYAAQAPFMKTQSGRGPIYPNAFFPLQAAIKNQVL